MTVETLLSRLEMVRRTGAGRWIARCPAHEDRRPSLGVRELDDGRLLLHCFFGCAVEDVLRTVGLTFDALYPERTLGHNIKSERRPFPAADVLRCVAFEALVVAAGAATLAHGDALAAGDHARLTTAAARLQEAARIGGGHA